MANIITAGNSTNGGTAITTDTSGTLNIVTGSGSGSNAITIDASQAVTMPGNLTVSGTLTASGGVTGSITSGTTVSASGTSVSFTGIPSGVKRITVMFQGVSTSGTSLPQIQIGSGTFTTSGYLSSGLNATASNGVANSTTGMLLDGNAVATNIRHGSATLTLINSSTNAWVMSSVMGLSDIAGVKIGGGSISLSGTLDRVRITTVNGTDTFDAGSINILFE
jgi:hypothetical protein